MVNLGLAGFVKLSPHMDEVEFYDVGETSPLFYFEIDKSGNIWFPISEGIGHLNVGTGALTKNYLLKNVDPISILVKNDSSVWLSYLGGLSHFNPQTGELIRYLMSLGTPQVFPFKMALREGKIYSLIMAGSFPLPGFSANVLGVFDTTSERFDFYNITGSLWNDYG
jgi:hypothetical protein